MQTGLACDDYDDASPGGELKMMKSQDWTRFMLKVPPAPVENGIGRYCSLRTIEISPAEEYVSSYVSVKMLRGRRA